MKKITVFTSTYNRKKEIENLYNSLLKQTYKNFEWVVVDDGSKDKTNEFFNKIINDNKIEINYILQPNSGKHIAFNKGVELAKSELFICVDSDDILTDNALELIIQYYEKFKDNSSICGFVFLKGYDNNKPVTEFFPNECIVANYNEYIINSNFKGDKCEVFLTNILKKYKFESFEDEKFLAEGYLWSIIGNKYDYVFINKIIYLCEYLDGGLTKSGRKLRISNPNGGRLHASIYIDSKYKLNIRIKNMILYIIYSLFANQKSITDYKLLKMICYLPALVIYTYWKIKYKK